MNPEATARKILTLREIDAQLERAAQMIAEADQLRFEAQADLGDHWEQIVHELFPECPFEPEGHFTDPLHEVIRFFLRERIHLEGFLMKDLNVSLYYRVRSYIANQIWGSRGAGSRSETQTLRDIICDRASHNRLRELIVNFDPWQFDWSVLENRQSFAPAERARMEKVGFRFSLPPKKKPKPGGQP